MACFPSPDWAGEGGARVSGRVRVGARHGLRGGLSGALTLTRLASARHPLPPSERGFVRPVGEPALDTRDIPAVAQPQILMPQALAAGQQAIGELLGRQRGVAGDILEPFRRVARGRLQLQHLDPPFRLIGGERPAEIGFAAAGLGQRDRILQRQLGAGADREMRSMGRVAHQHDIVLAPARIGDARKRNPGRAAAMARLGDQPVAVEPLGKESFAERYAGGSVGRLQPGGAPTLLARLDDEGRGAGLEAKAWAWNQPQSLSTKSKVKASKRRVVPSQMKRFPPLLDIRLEMRGMQAADPAVDAGRPRRSDRPGRAWRDPRPDARNAARRRVRRRGAAGCSAAGCARCRRSRARPM